VLAWPGLGARARNPYTWLLCSHLAALGVRIRDFSPARALRGGYDVLHIHWPEKALNAESLFGRVAGAVAALAMLEAAHLHGARVVWTVHNARPHESRHPRLEEWFGSAVVRRVDTVIHPSVAGQQAVEARYPELARLPKGVVPLGHFLGTYPDTMSRDDARAGLGIPEGVRVVTFLGLVRPYKNVPHLVRTVRALPREAGEVVLLVGGAPQTPALANEVREAAGGDPRVRLALQHIPDDEVQRYLRAADLVVLPFREITNSASALLALSFDRPVLVPARGAMGELQTLVGTDWVRTYDGDLTCEVLAHAVEWARRRPRQGPNLKSLDWESIARQTLAIYLAATR
jgi:glycosyltransferase involved in cell wall biosynthesis